MGKVFGSWRNMYRADIACWKQRQTEASTPNSQLLFSESHFPSSRLLTKQSCKRRAPHLHKRERMAEKLQNPFLSPLECWGQKATRWAEYQRLTVPLREKRHIHCVTFDSAWGPGWSARKPSEKTTLRIMATAEASKGSRGLWTSLSVLWACHKYRRWPVSWKTWAAITKYHRVGSLNKNHTYHPQSWMLGIQVQGASKFNFCRGPIWWLAGGHLLVVSSHRRESAQALSLFLFP
jgi:hypothetical protein